MTEHRYAPRFSKRTTLGVLAAVTIGVFGLGMALPYAVGDAPEAAKVVQSTTETTARRRQPVPVAQVVPSTTTTSTPSR